MLNTSIVLYKHTVSEIAPLVELLNQSEVVSEVFLLDNSPEPNKDFKSLAATYIFNNKNLGYGAAHNIAIRKTMAENLTYHLVLNPDISFDPVILEKIVHYMNNNANIGHLMPKVFYPHGEIQYLCKLIPTPFDLFFRRFLPEAWTKKRTEKFEMRSFGYDKIMDVPYLSGCFMFLRIAALNDIGLFDERYFMYPEDIDLTRRMHAKHRTVFYPEVSIIHHHAKSSYLSLKMLFIHLWNISKYFNKWGWIFDKERRRINKKILSNLQ